MRQNRSSMGARPPPQRTGRGWAGASGRGAVGAGVVEETVGGLADQLVLLPAEQFRRGRVREGDAAALVGVVDALAGELEDAVAFAREPVELGVGVPSARRWSVTSWTIPMPFSGRPWSSRMTETVSEIQIISPVLRT